MITDQKDEGLYVRVVNLNDQLQDIYGELDSLCSETSNREGAVEHLEDARREVSAALESLQSIELSRRARLRE